MGCGSGKDPVPGGGNADKNGASGSQDLLSQYVLGAVLGQGAFGVVYACSKKGGKPNFCYAVKMVDKVETPIGEIKKEAEMLQLLACSTVSKFHGIYYEKCFVCIVMDKYDGGDLIECMQDHWKKKGKIPPHKVVHVVAQMAAAIHYCHGKLVVHRDVKGDNYLTDRKDIIDPACRVFMSDVGTAIQLSSPTQRLTNTVGTKLYWSPEFYKGNYGPKVDCFAMGVIMYGLVDSRFPFKSESDLKNKSVKLPATCPPTCANMVLSLIDKDEGKRLNSKQMVDHPWVVNVEVPSDDQPDVSSSVSEQIEPDSFREGGPDAGQDARRQELVDRLQQKGTKVKSSQALSVLWSPKFDVKDKRSGKSLRYEWRSEAQVKKDVVNIDEAGRLTEAGTKVDVKAMGKTLKDHGIDVSKFGKQTAKTLDQFATEVHNGSASLMLNAAEHKQLVRVVDVVLLRMVYGVGSKKRIMIEFSEVMADGRTRPNLNRLPGTKKEPHENTKKTAERISKDMVGISGSKGIKFDFANLEVYEEEDTSPSYPGVKTVYRKEIVEGVVQDAHEFKNLGINGSWSYSHCDPKRNTKEFRWLLESECKQKDIKTHAPEDGDEISGLVQAPIGYSPDELYHYLKEEHLDPDKFDGKNKTKTLKEFANELVKGEATLMLNTENVLVRVVDIVLLLLKKEGSADFLVETKETYSDGKEVVLNHLPGTKRRPDENQFSTAQRVLKKQLKVDENFVMINKEDVRVIEETKESPSYPGLATVYRKRIIQAELAKA